MSSRLAYRLPLGALLMLTLACCTSPSDDTSPSNGGPLPKVTHPAARMNPDRDPTAVDATLGRLNPCDLLPPSAARRAAVTQLSIPRAGTPTSCRTDSDDVSITVELGVPSTHDTRFGLQAAPLGGAHGYLRAVGSTCELVLPVSFKVAVEYEVNDRRSPSNSCAVAKAYGTVAVDTLAKPKLRPAPRWSACAALARGLNVSADAKDLKFSRGHSCSRNFETLMLLHARGIESDRGDRFQIAGHPARRSQEAHGCWVFWLEGPAGPEAGPNQKLLGVVDADSCDRATTLATAIVKVMAKAPPGTPLRGGLTLPASGPDSPYPGGCGYLLNPENCQPYHPVEVPDDARQAARQAEADPHTNCAIGVDAVTKHLGSKFRGIIDTSGPTGCRFVEPNHALSVWIELNLDDPRIRRTSAPTTIAGRPAWPHDDSRVARNGLWVRIADDVLLSVSATDRPGRVRVPPVTRAQVTAITSDIVTSLT